MNETTERQLCVTPMEVRWRDLDAFNHVNNASYLTYLEEARLNWLMQLPGVLDDSRSKPVMAACQLDYRAPIRWPADIEVQLFLERLGERSITLGHKIMGREDGHLYCDGKVTLVWIDPTTGRSTRLPDALRRAIG